MLHGAMHSRGDADCLLPHSGQALLRCAVSRAPLGLGERGEDLVCAGEHHCSRGRWDPPRHHRRSANAETSGALSAANAGIAHCPMWPIGRQAVQVHVWPKGRECVAHWEGNVWPTGRQCVAPGEAVCGPRGADAHSECGLRR